MSGSITTAQLTQLLVTNPQVTNNSLTITLSAEEIAAQEAEKAAAKEEHPSVHTKDKSNERR